MDSTGKLKEITDGTLCTSHQVVSKSTVGNGSTALSSFEVGDDKIVPTQNITSHKSILPVGNGDSLKDQLLEYNVDDDDDDVIIVEIKNGCDNTRLCKNVGLSLTNRLENVHICSYKDPMAGQDEVHDFQDREQTTEAAFLRNCEKCSIVETNQKSQNQRTQNNQTKEPVYRQLNSKIQPKLSSNVIRPLKPSADIQGIYNFENCTNFNRNHSVTESMPLNDSSFPNASLASSTKSPSALSYSDDCRKLIDYVNGDNKISPNNMLHSSNLLRKRQQTFLKSQSLDLHNDDNILTSPNANQHLLFNQLPEINEFKSPGKTPACLNTEIDNLKSGIETCNLSKNSQTTSDSASSSQRDLNRLSPPTHSQSVDYPSDDITTRTIQRPNVASQFQSFDSRPIYPNVPFSPYGSPYGSPRSNRRPLRESRRISIEKSGSFLQLNQYKLMDQIGQGSYGLVKLAYSEEDSTHYAMKILSKRRLLRQAGLMRRGPKKTTSPLDRVYREIAVLKKLDHQNVVKLVEVLDDPAEDSLYMVFELVKQGEVLAIPTDKPMSEERAWSVFRDTLMGLEYLHYQRIIHADLKPGNLLLTECGHVKIADLGVCNEFLGADATMTNGSTAGTPAFRAPETLILGQNVYCGRAADIWSLGATLYSLVFGNVPFVANSIPLLYEKIQSEELLFPAAPKISPELKECIELMLMKDPTKRISLPLLKINKWVSADGKYPLPNEDENCRLVQVNEDDINSVVRSIPKLDTLILIKTMLKNHSFGNPFAKGISGRAPQRGGSRLERFIRAGRSNSAPGSYHLIERQQSGENMLPALSELVSTSNNDDL